MSEYLTEILAAEKLSTNRDMLLKLERAIAHLLEKDPEKLIHILYRIDVDETKFTVALQNSIGNSAKDIALLIYERLLQKAALRKDYDGSGNPSSEEKW